MMKNWAVVTRGSLLGLGRAGWMGGVAGIGIGLGMSDALMGQTMIMSVDPSTPAAFGVNYPTGAAAEFLTVRLLVQNTSSTPTLPILGATIYANVTGGSSTVVHDLNFVGSAATPLTGGFFGGNTRWTTTQTNGIVRTDPSPWQQQPWNNANGSLTSVVTTPISAQNSSSVSANIEYLDDFASAPSIAGNSGQLLLGEVTIRRGLTDYGPWVVRMFLPDSSGDAASEFSGYDSSDPMDPTVVTYSLNTLQFQIAAIPEPEVMAMGVGLALVGVGAWRRATAGGGRSQS